MKKPKTHTKKNVSLPIEYNEFLEQRVARLNDPDSGMTTDYSKQIAVAVRLLMQEDAAEYGRAGNAPAPQAPAPAPIARKPARYSTPRK
jgi:hypothetical protein